MKTSLDTKPNTETVLARIYLWVMLLGLPLVIHHGYFDITETKSLFFAAATGILLLGRGVLALQRGVRFRRLEAGELCAVSFCLICLFSTAFCGRLGESFFGRIGRWQGAGMMLLYGGLYFAFSGAELRREDVLRPLTAGFLITAALAVLNHLGWDPLGLSRELSTFDRGRYISTLGNINFSGAYFSLTLPVIVWFLLNAEGWKWAAWLGSLSVLGVWAAMAVRSESAVLGLGAAMALLPLFLKGRTSALRRWPLLLPGLAAAMQLYRLLARWCGAFLSALTRVLLHPAVSAALTAAGLLLWLMFRGRGEESLRRVRKGYARLLLGGFVLSAAALALLNTVWRSVPLGSMETWLRFSPEWGTDRGKVWAYCLAIYREFPVLEKLVGGGCGVLARIDMVRRIFPDAVLDTAHCEYLQILLNWGAFGLGTYLAWQLLAAREILRRGDDLSLALLAGLTGYAAQALVNIAQAPGISLFFVLLAVSRRRE